MPRVRVRAEPDPPRRAAKADPALAAAAALALEAAQAREDILLFARRTIVDESTGQPVTYLPPHVERFLRALADPRIKHLCLTAFPGAAKTTAIAATIAWFCCRAAQGYHAMPCIYATSSEQVGRSFLRAVQRVATSEFATQAFPNSTRIRWTQTTAELPEAGRLPLLVAVGPESKILSRRSAFLVADDTQPPQLARFGGRDAIARSESWFHESLMTRVLDANSRVVVSAAPYGPGDLVSQLARRPDWTTIAVRARDAEGRPTWPQRFPEATLTQIEVSDPSTWRRTWMLDSSVGDSRQLFSEECIARALAAGRSIYPRNGFVDVPIAVLAVDPAFSEKRSADATGIVAVAIEPNGRRQIVDAVELHQGPADLVRSVIRLATKYGITPNQGMVVVESNAGQAALVALLEAACPRLPVVSRALTAQAKWDPESSTSLPGLAASFARGRWVLPNLADGTQPESTTRMVAALRAARADAESHLPDLVAALLHAHWYLDEELGWINLNMTR